MWTRYSGVSFAASKIAWAAATASYPCPIEMHSFGVSQYTRLRKGENPRLRFDFLFVMDMVLKRWSSCVKSAGVLDHALFFISFSVPASFHSLQALLILNQ